MHNLQALILSEISHIEKKLTEIKKINKKRETLKIKEKRIQMLGLMLLRSCMKN